MKAALLKTSLLSLSLLSATYIVKSQSFNTDTTNPVLAVATTDSRSGMGDTARMGKEIPVAGSELFVSPANWNATEKKCGTEKKAGKAGKKDKKEVTRVIGHSVDNYLSTLYAVHTLQRF